MRLERIERTPKLDDDIIRISKKNGDSIELTGADIDFLYSFHHYGFMTGDG